MKVSFESISIEDGFGVYFKNLRKLKMVESNAWAMPHGVIVWHMSTFKSTLMDHKPQELAVQN